MLIKKIDNYQNFEILKNQVVDLVRSIDLPIISLQYRDVNEQNWDNATGWHHGPVEQEFIHIMPSLEGTEIDSMIKNSPYGMVRTRIMVVKPGKKYTVHYDNSPRIHIPIVSNEECRFIFYAPNKIIGDYLEPDGSIYWVDTRKYHTFYNKSQSDRIHVVALTNYELPA